MTVSEEKLKKLFMDIKDVCITIAKDAHVFIGNHELNSNPFFTDIYPATSNDIFYNEEHFKKADREKIPILKYRIPIYEMRSFTKDKKYYTAVFDGYGNNHISLKDYEKIDEIKTWINSDSEMVRLFTKENAVSDYFVRGTVGDIVERYLYMTNATENIPDDLEDKLKQYIIEKLSYYLDEDLPFDICVPICLATFDKDIKLDDSVEIVKISDELQKARQAECKYEVYYENCVAACATHMIVIHGYSVQKNDWYEYSFNLVIRDYASYPLEKIDEVVGIIRVATGYDIGYEQIFCIPKGWVYRTTADLLAVYGAKSHFVNPKFIKMLWMNLPVSYVTSEQCDDIFVLYKSYKANDNKLKFPLMRFNRCMLRDEIDDMTTDACIGIEALLARGTKGEISYTISNRFPVILSKVDSSDYLPQDGRKFVKKIYNLRSRIVHGDVLKDKDTYVVSGETKLYVPKLAVDFLRMSIVFMIKNPQYLEDEEIEKYLDSLISNS